MGLRRLSERAVRSTSRAVLGLITACALIPAEAQQYPNRPVRFVVGFAPGGSNDLIARIVGSKLSHLLGQAFVIDNRPGAGGTIATALVAAAPSDGHTILLVPASFAYESTLYAKLPYQPERDLMPISQVASAPFIFLASNSLKARSIAELVNLAKERPGEINSAHAGIGNFTHLTMELLKVATGINLTAVTYKGSGPALIALMSGEVQLTSTALPPAIALVKAGKVRALAVTSGKRSSLMPDVPTVSESGVPGYEAVGWWGVVVPRRVSREIVARLSAEVVRAVDESEVRANLARLGADPVGSTPEAFEDFVKSESAKWRKVISSAGIVIQ